MSDAPKINVHTGPDGRRWATASVPGLAASFGVAVSVEGEMTDADAIAEAREAIEAHMRRERC